MLRSCILSAAILAGAATGAGAEALDGEYLILRKGDVIGFHRVDITKTDEATLVDTRIEMKVKFGPIPVFRYSHTSKETWSDGELVSLETRTFNDGERDYVKAAREDGVLMIDGSKFDGAAPAGAFPTSYWNKDLVEADALLNTQTGEIIEVDVDELGQTEAPHNRLAEHYRVAGSVVLNIWYDGERWVGSNFTVDGEELTYVPVQSEREFSMLEKFLN